LEDGSQWSTSQQVYAVKVCSVRLQEPTVITCSEITPLTIHTILYKREKCVLICANINGRHIEHNLLIVVSKLEYGPWFQVYGTVKVLLYNVIQMTVYHLIVQGKKKKKKKTMLKNFKI
jgi:hypothetical protein